MKRVVPIVVNDEFRMALETGCDSLESRRYVGLFGGYIAAEAASPEAALDGSCRLDADLIRFRTFLNRVDMLTDCAPNPPP